MKDGARNLEILGVKVSSSRLEEVIKRIEIEIEKETVQRPFFVVTINPEFIMLAQEDSEFKRVLNMADLAIADGMGLRLVRPDLEITPGRKVVEKLLTYDYRVFFLGGRGGVAKLMAQKYGGEGDEGHENIQFSIFNFQINSKIIEKINKFRPDILLVAYGAPWQEKWLAANSYRLKAKVVMGVGGTFDYLTGRAKLPPEGVSRLGLEWLWRLVHEPWRWGRQLALVRFARLIWARNL